MCGMMRTQTKATVVVEVERNYGPKTYIRRVEPMACGNGLVMTREVSG
jgi:hypothetical protein